MSRSGYYSSDVAAYRRRIGGLASGWMVMGIGVFLAMLVGGVGVGMMAGGNSPKVVVGTKDEVFYSGLATRADALALGEALRGVHYFLDRGTTVLMNKDGDGMTISLVQGEDAVGRPGMLDAAEEMVREVAPSVGGFPVKVRLVDAEEVVRNEGMVGRAVIGERDEVYYFNDATEAQARALGEKLRAMGYLEGRGVSVMLNREDGVTRISYVVSDGFWENPAHGSQFVGVTRAVAPEVGGLPVTMRLVSTSLVVEREMVVE